MAYRSKKDQAAAAKKHYEANLEIMKARAAENKKRNRAISKPYVDAIKFNTPCADCKRNFHPVSMDFDHISDDKNKNVSVMVNAGYNLAAIKAEIDKCVLVCASCHRLRTFLRSEGFILT